MRYKLYSIGDLPILKIANTGYSYTAKDTSFGPQVRDRYIVCYVLSGKGTYNNHPLCEGQGFFVSPGGTEHIFPDLDEPWELLWFSSFDENFATLFPYYNASGDDHIFSHNSPPELNEIKKLLISNNRKTISDAEMLELFFSVFKHLSTQKEDVADSSAAQRYIDFSVNYIKANYGKKLTISTLTALLGISQPYLYTIFRQKFGKSPKDFLQEYRISQAKKQLSETNLSVSEIARNVGFCDSFAFSKAFYSKESTSPTEYRAQHKK